MKNISPAQQKEIILKNETLETTRVQLKKEFVGIDDAIDRLIDMSRAWYIFPEFQQKPTIINLWGMTGVGKTSLVNRFAKLIGFDNKLVPFDLGESSSDRWSFEREIKDLIKHKGNDQFILMFDEFQHARTIKNGSEVERPSSRMIWEIIDTGKYKMVDIDSEVWHLGKVILLMEECVKAGVKSKNGVVTKGLREFLSIFEGQAFTRRRIRRRLSIEKRNKITLFFPSETNEALKSIFPNRFLTDTIIHRTFSKLNEIQTLSLLKQLYDEACKPKLYDCSKAIIFVVGNLDEAYQISSNMSADISADSFYDYTRKITITKIKDSLRHRFRPEQISRLGNNHIIYPSLNTDAFGSLITLELKRIQQYFKIKTDIQINFDESVHQLLFNEGVYPTQGARPLLSTISNLIEAKLPKIVANILVNKVRCDVIHLSFENNCLLVDCKINNSVPYRITEPVELALEKLRESKRNDRQAIIAVHESGHAVVYLALFNRLPEQIISVSTEAGSSGFMQTNPDCSYPLRNSCVLGGSVFSGSGLCTTDFRLTKGWCLV